MPAIDTKDQKCVDQLYDQYAPILYGRILRDFPPVEADEILVKTFLSICKQIDSYDASKSRFSTWVLRLADMEIRTALKTGALEKV